MTDLIVVENNEQRRNHQRDAIFYLAEQARNAHEEGDGILVNHLCSLALEEIDEWLKKNIFSLTIEDIHWAFTFSHYWLIDDYMLNLGIKVIEKFKSQNTNDLYAILNSLSWFVRECLASIDGEIINLKKCNFEWLPDTPRAEDILLLKFVIELVWYSDPASKDWIELGNIWTNKLPTKARDEVEKLINRLLIQTKVLYPSSAHRFKKNILEHFDNDTQSLYAAWGCFFNCEWDQLKNILIKLIGSITFESALAIPLFHLHHITRFQNFFSKKSLNKEQNQTSQFVGLTRRRFQIASRKETLFDEFRSMRFYYSFKDLIRVQDESNATVRFHCFRLAMLNQIAALRSWELANWLEGLSQQYESYRELLRFDNQQYLEPFTAEAIILASSAGKFKDDDVVIIKAIQKFDQAPADLKYKVIMTLLGMQYIMWPRVLKILTVMSDAIPEDLLPGVANWCVNYFERQKKSANNFTSPPKLLALWNNVIGYTNNSIDLCKILLPIVLSAAKDMLDVDMDLQHYILKAPINYASSITDAIVNIESTDTTYNSKRWYFLYSLTRLRPELMSAYKSKLIELSKTPEQKFYLNLIHNDPTYQAEELKSWCRDKIHSYSKSICDRTRPSGGFGNVLDAKLIRSLTWDNQADETIKQVLNSISSEHIQPYEIANLLEVLSALIENGTCQQIDIVRPNFVAWMMRLPKGQTTISNRKDPLSAFQFNLPDSDEICLALCDVAIVMLKNDEGESAPIVANWITENIQTAPLRPSPFYFYLIAMLGMSRKFLSEADFVLCLQTLFLRTAQNDPSSDPNNINLASLLSQISSFFDPESEEEINFIKTEGSTQKEIFLKILPSWVSKLVHHDNAKVRIYIAQIAMNFKNGIKEPNSYIDNALEILKLDGRARVRQAAKDFAK